MNKLTQKQLDAIETELIVNHSKLDGRMRSTEGYTTHDKWAFLLVDELMAIGRWQMILHYRNNLRYREKTWFCTLEYVRSGAMYVGESCSRQVAICLAYLCAKDVDVNKLLEGDE